MSICPPVPSGSAFLSGMLAHIDCQAQTIGAAGYQALSSPGSAASMALTSLLTIFVALFGFQMLLGRTPSARDGVIAAMKIGIVLVLATSWGAYRTTVYDVVLHAPAELASTIGGAAALPGSAGGMAGRLQNVDDLILYFASVGTGQPLLAAQTELSAIERARITNPGVTDSFAFSAARTSFLVSTLSSLAVLRVGGGILLALAPLFAGFLLFEATRGLFMGWLRALGAITLGGLAAAIILSVELAVMEPWLSDALGRRSANFATPAAPSELLAMTIVFGLAIWGVIALLARLAFTVHVSTSWFAEATQRLVGDRRTSSADPLPVQAPRAPLTEQSRALLIAHAVARDERRSAHMVAASSGGPTSVAGAVSSTNAGAVVAPQAPVGRQLRRARPRLSAAARRRDR